ncbi:MULTISPECIES: Na+/H+ antiporter subunit E [Marinobacter]|jgi:multicomponent K+:H+ antiporter subunit E|uniref:Na+/H+ antiporter subunit E n=3 Tax=Marinobacter TaxID=2742 RepID=A0A5M3PVT1_9GAMM|nr:MULTISPECIES: Na+/H+ antiporter subunit E [Marinobacter]MBO6810670.1 Na+/H+ antiporter subunit E [Marinobacter sp.]MBO6874499.1 Na+/H+ antiporter subunit E [Marinobacter sp.]MBY6070975.1 Na+/H+ antiporter subunit E [Marinobacter salsuginis]MTI99482.1 Na+/H+ antiporter subunit E [Marinobacter adhaerens]ODM31734.1 Na+/H+ antiporter subunit E [Marinobacter adhaerens]|tara:strand:+ start:3871 stop:4359 length:489 start_codon:yes stop_codon:yes gene_type:complete
MLDRLSFPQPWLSLILFTTWQLLSDGVSGASVVMGIILAWLIPQITQGFWPERPAFIKSWKMPAYLAIVLKDIVVASFSVARLILSPRQPRPIFVCYPLQLEHPLAISILASTISLTPGTVSADVSDDQKTLLIHTLDAGSDQEVIDAIHKRYEKPLMEMFQ